MRAVALVVAACVLSVAFAIPTCSGWNVTMNPGIQPTLIGSGSIDQNHRCPYGYYLDGVQGYRCITYRALVNNQMRSLCHVDSDCSSASGLVCGRDKRCTWSQTRAQDDSCVDSRNCLPYIALNGTSVEMGCDATTKTCRPMVHVLGGTGSRCGYSEGTQKFMCNDDNKCVYFDDLDATPQKWGTQVCVALLKNGEDCSTTKKYNVGCASGLTCILATDTATKVTCNPKRKESEKCSAPGETNCDQTTNAGRLYCSSSNVCTRYLKVGDTCQSSYAPGSFVRDQCGNGLRCLSNEQVPATFVCTAEAAVDRACTLDNDFSGKNCTAGLQCISHTATVPKFTGRRCIAGSVDNACQIYNFAAPQPLIRDSCQPGLFCQSFADYTCVNKIVTGGSCNATYQCVDGLNCYNRTCTAYQALNQPCNTLTTDPLTQLLCEPGLQCSRGFCISNYTVGLNGICTNDIDCDTAHCDAVLRRCTRRKLCKADTDCTGGATTGPDANNYCACSAGAENMGQCVLNTCGKQHYALVKCLNPLYFDVYANSSRYQDPHKSFYDVNTYDRNRWFLDSGSSFYSKCSGQWSDFVRCQGLMHKWGAPSVALGDLVNFDLATISASSTVSTSFMVLIAFVMSAIMYL